MTVLSQTFFALVRGHLVAFSFLSAGHFTLSLEVNIDYVRCKEFRNCLLHFLHEHLCGLESGNLVFGDNDFSTVSSTTAFSMPVLFEISVTMSALVIFGFI